MWVKQLLNEKNSEVILHGLTCSVALLLLNIKLSE